MISVSVLLFILGMLNGASGLKDTGYNRWQGTILKTGNIYILDTKTNSLLLLSESWQPDLPILTILEEFSLCHLVSASGKT